MSLKKTLAAVGLVLALTGSGAAAYGATQYPNEGGTWNYGLAAGVHAYSDYYVGKCHGSTVINDWGTSKSIDTAKNKWSQASLRATAFTSNKYYYRVC